MKSSIEKQILAVRKSGGYLLLHTTGLIKISGADAETYLHARTSNDVKGLGIGHGQFNSLLDRKGYILAYFSLHRLADGFLLLTQYEQIPEIMQQLETYRFREQVTFEDLSSKYYSALIQGPASLALIKKVASNNEPLPENELDVAELVFWNSKAILIKQSFSGELGYVLLYNRADTRLFGEELAIEGNALSMVPLSSDSYEVLRIEAGIPIFGQDMSIEEMLPETGLEQYAASYNKGCFQGQEVLARIKTYGAPKRALVGLIFDPPLTNPFSAATEFSINGEPAGTIRSCVYSPTMKRVIALSYISREYRVPDKAVSVQIDGESFAARVSFLPFLTASSNKERAQKLFADALAEFAHGSEDETIKILRMVLEADPHFTDAYESLGVILARQEQLDEAIALMHKLQELDPESIMAHSNLSLFYMQQGDKEKAEEEKAIAMSIRMSKIAKEVVAKQQAEAGKEQQQKEAKERMSMFEQVLAIDKNDLLANYALGNVYVELEDFEKAIPYLKKALEVKPTHTVAYLALGKAYENLQRHKDAQSIYEQGIEVAAKRGDITPMNEMKAQLNDLQKRMAN